MQENWTLYSGTCICRVVGSPATACWIDDYGLLRKRNSLSCPLPSLLVPYLPPYLPYAHSSGSQMTCESPASRPGRC